MLYSALVRRVFSIIAVAAALTLPIWSQNPKAEFDAASIRPSEPGGFDFGSGTGTGGPGTSDPGMYRCTRCTLATLIAKAFNLQDYQLPGRTSLSGNKFEVMAKIPAGTTPADFQVMLQNLLKERFALTGHFTEKSLRGYHLTVAKGGSKLQESTGSARPAANPDQHGGFGRGGAQGGDHGHTGVINFGGNARYRAEGQTTADLARILADQIGVPVDDQTGLTGKYNIALSWSGTANSNDNHQGGPGGAGHGDHGGGAPGGASTPDSGPTIFDALQSQLGLRLVRADQTTARIFIIDHVNPQPTAN